MILVVMLFWDFLFLSDLFIKTEAFLDICYKSDLMFKMFTYCTSIVRGTHIKDHFGLLVKLSVLVYRNRIIKNSMERRHHRLIADIVT